MGYLGSRKLNHQPLVIQCRKRKTFLKAAAEHRYALAAAHTSYFLALKDVGEALKKFVDEDLVHTTSFQDFTSDDDEKCTESSTYLSEEDPTLQEAVSELRDEFAIASGNGLGVAAMLEVDKLPVQQSLFGEIWSKIVHKSSSSSEKLLAAKSYLGDEHERESYNYKLVSTLDSLYVWEKKLYKEIKAEEKLRLDYEKQCKVLQHVDTNGAEATRTYEIRASIQKLDTQLNVHMKPIVTISTKIHMLRDEVLQPQLAELVQGLISMWNLVFASHQKQLQAIMDVKMETLEANREKPNSKACRELEMKLRAWSSSLNDWMKEMKLFVHSLNGWLMLFLENESETQGIFSMCNDWSQAMEAVSSTELANAIDGFASRLHGLSEKRDEEMRQRAKTRKFIPNEARIRIQKHLLERGSTLRELDALSDGSLLSQFSSDEKGVKNVDFRLLWKRMVAESDKHQIVIKMLHGAAANVQEGLDPLFMALESFSSKALKVQGQVRLAV